MFRKRFEVEKLDPDDVEMEDLNFYYANYSRYVVKCLAQSLGLNTFTYSIYNDVITLRRGSSYMYVTCAGFVFTVAND